MNTRVFSLCIALGVALTAPRAQAQASPSARDDAPMEVTTDTSEYCRHLRQQLDARRDAPDEVRALTVEGWTMCSHGHVIGGLARLRRAVTILRDGTGGR